MAAKSLHSPTAFLSSSKVIGFLASKSFAVIGVETGMETFLEGVVVYGICEKCKKNQKN